MVKNPDLECFLKTLGEFEGILNRFSHVENGKNRGHLQRFFAQVSRQTPERNAIIQEALRVGNTIIPPYDFWTEILPDVFSYSGWDETKGLRNTWQKDAQVSRMLDEELEKGPALVIDLGTYKGQRTKEIVSSLRNKGNINHLIGIDSNPVVKTAFDGFDTVPSTAFNFDARRALEFFRPGNNRVIYLGLENIFLNMEKIGGCQHQGIPGILGRALGAGDSAIMELTNYHEDDHFVDGVEEVFHRYFVESGLQSILGGKLKTQNNHHDERSNAKLVYIAEMNERVEFGGEVFDFSTPPVKYSMMGGEPLEIPEMSSTKILLGVSDTVPYSEMFSVLFASLLNYIHAPNESDIQTVGNQTILKMVRETGVRPDDGLFDTELRDSIKVAMRFGQAPIYNSYSCVMLGGGHYPAHYNRFMHPQNEMFARTIETCQNPSEEGVISDAVKHFLLKRCETMNPKMNNNMAGYKDLWFKGQAPSISFTYQDIWDKETELLRKHRP